MHIGDGNAIRCHEGSLRIGDKVVFGKDNVVNTYLDIEIGASTLVADWCYICDFDHQIDDITIADQGSGHRQGPGPDRPGHLGRRQGLGAAKHRRRPRCVLGAHAVVKGEIPDYSHRGRRARARGQEPQGRLGVERAERAELAAPSPTSSARRLLLREVHVNRLRRSLSGADVRRCSAVPVDDGSGVWRRGSRRPCARPT